MKAVSFARSILHSFAAWRVLRSANHSWRFRFESSLLEPLMKLAACPAWERLLLDFLCSILPLVRLAKKTWIIASKCWCSPARPARCRNHPCVHCLRVFLSFSKRGVSPCVSSCETNAEPGTEIKIVSSQKASLLPVQFLGLRSVDKSTVDDCHVKVNLDKTSANQRSIAIILNMLSS